MSNRLKKCPKCRSTNYTLERCINSNACCIDCHYKGKPEEFHDQTNFGKITESPEKLAIVLEKIVGSCGHCPAEIECDHKKTCTESLANWLKRESKENG